MTFRKWLSQGFRVKKGEKSIRSFTIVKDEDNEKKYFKTVHLFFYPQVEKVEK